MPIMTKDRIQFIPLDRQAISEQSVNITSSEYAAIFNNALSDGNTTAYFKFLEEIAEKDPDILEALETRSSYVTSKEWQIEDENGEQDDTALEIQDALWAIKGDKFDGLLSIDELISSFLGASYLTGLSFSEIITDDNQILGFNHVPCHFLTFRDSTFYPRLWTQEKEENGEAFNREKMVAHYLTRSTDPARGYLGNAVAWQYVFKRLSLGARQRFENKYGKGFLLINMPMARDGFEKNWEVAEKLVENYSNADGAVFEGDVLADFKESIQAEGDYFWNAEHSFKSNITRIILGQESTSSVEDSNRSTADVHMEVLEKRTMDDMAAIENTINNQLLPKVKQLLGIGEDSNYQFKFVISDMEATLDDDMEDETAVEQDQDSPKASDTSSTVGDTNLEDDNDE